MNRPTLNFNSRSMPGRWRKLIEAADRIVAFSPYITNSAVTKAMETKGTACELYTVVSLEVYASGASKIGCLKRLMKANVKVFHLENLHAKILLVPKMSVTIGSQNMTVGGAGNHESTVIWQDANAAQQTEKEIADWRKAGKCVTDALVHDLETKLKALQAQHTAWKKQAQKATDLIWANWEWEEARKRWEKAQAEAAAARRAQAAERNPVQRYASEIVRGKLKEMNGGWSLINYPERSDRPPSYCEWVVDGKTRHLSGLVWHPCFHLETRQWGKARACKQRISFIDRSMRTGLMLNLAPGQFSLDIRCRRGGERSAQNLEMTVMFGRMRAKVLGNYDIDRLTLDVAKNPYVNRPEFDPTPFQPLLDAVNQNTNGARDLILERILERWDGSSMGSWNRVDKFFDLSRTIYTRLRVLEDGAVLVFSSKYWTNNV